MSWPQVALGECIEVLSGYAFKSKKFNNDGHGLPLIRIRDVVPGHSNTFYEGEYDNRFMIENGDILIGMDGEFNVARWKSGKALLNQRVCKVTSVDKHIDEEYIFRLLPKVLKKIEDETPYVTVKHLSARKLKAEKISLPPLEEQKRIATILDQADAIVKQRQVAFDKLGTLGQSIFYDMFGDEDFPTKPLKNLGSVLTGKTPPTSKPECFGGSIPFVTPGDMETDEPVERSLTNIGANYSKTVREGSTLVCCIGATIGKIYQAPKLSSFNQQINAVEWSDLIIPEYGTYALRGRRGRIRHLGQGASTTLPILKKSLFEEIKIPVAPLTAQIAFQKRILHIEDQLRIKKVAQLKQNILFASLQQRAFRGEL